MKKLTLKANKQTRDLISDTKERITIQFRIYDKHGNYHVVDDSITGNFTIHLKDCSLPLAKQIVVNSLLNSHFIDKKIDIEE